MRWMVLGSGPGSVKFYDAARRESDRVVTCNAGVLVCPDPAAVFLSDLYACERFAPVVREMRKEHGTRLITIKRTMGGLQARSISDADELLPVFEDEKRPFERGLYSFNRWSGFYCLQYAVNNGATAVHVVGMDGRRSTAGNLVTDSVHYQPTPARPTGGKPTDLEDTLGDYATSIRQVVRACPDVEFVWWGRPVYDIDGPNVTIKEEPEHGTWKDRGRECVGAGCGDDAGIDRGAVGSGPR